MNDLQSDGVDLHKVNKAIAFPLALDIQQQCSRDLVLRNGGQFTLAGVVVHQGYTFAQGHYWGVHKWPSGQWVLYDDRLVKPVTEAFVLSLQREAYVLVYEAVDSFHRTR